MTAPQNGFDGGEKSQKPVFFCLSSGLLGSAAIGLPKGTWGMEQDVPNTEHGVCLKFNRPLRILTAWQIQKIDRTLEEAGPFAEVRLIKRDGKLRFIERLESENLADSPGSQK